MVEVSQQLDKDAVSIGRIDQDLAPVEGIDMVVALKRDLLILETLLSDVEIIDRESDVMWACAVLGEEGLNERVILFGGGVLGMDTFDNETVGEGELCTI